MSAMAREGLHLLGFSYCLPQKHCLKLISMVSLYPSVHSALMLQEAPTKSTLLYGLVDNRLSRGSFSGRPRPELDKAFLLRVRQCSAAVPMKEALQRFAVYATGSASEEHLLYGPVDNRLLRGSFNRYGWPRPELWLCFDSANGRGTAVECPRKSLKLSQLAI